MATPISSVNSVSDSPYISNLLSHLPKVKFCSDYDLYQWEGFWYLPAYLEAAIAFRSHFEARDDDVILASSPKSGTTWLKALVFCIMNESCCKEDNSKEDPFNKNTPHDLVQSFEAQIYKQNPSPDLQSIPSPRLFHTHMPYSALPTSIKKTGCKIVDIARNPKDTFTSMFHFMNAARKPELEPVAVEDLFESFCNGACLYGPYFDHVLGYWKEHLKNPNKILFLKYEDMKSDPRGQLKKLASFLGKPFLNDEDVDEVLRKCNIERLKNMEVNKYGNDKWSGISNSSFFRLGMVDDWKNLFTPEMIERLNAITSLRFEGSGLHF